MVQSEEKMISEKERAVCLSHGYEMTDKFLGGGAVGRVFLAQPSATKIASCDKLRLVNVEGKQLKVAIKIIYADVGIKDLTKLTKFVPGEITNMNKAFGNPNIITLLDVFVSCKRIFLVMEYAEKGNLKSLYRDYISKNMKSPYFSEDKARNYFQEILSGLQFLHDRNIAHRDLKLENILVTEKGAVKLGDLGFSIKLPQWEANRENFVEMFRDMVNTTLCGTPGFMAPEVLLTTCGYNGIYADLWSIGVVLFVLVNGYYPFPGKTVKDVLRQYEKAKYKELPFRKGLSAECKDLINRLLNHNSWERPSIRAVFAHPWMNSFCEISSVEKPIFRDQLKVLDQNPLYKHQEKYVRSYLRQRTELLKDTQDRLLNQKSSSKSEIEDCGIRIMLPRQDTNGVCVYETWRFMGKNIHNPQSNTKSGKGVGLNPQSASNGDKDNLGFPRVKRVISDTPLIRRWRSIRDKNLPPLTELEKCIQLYNTVDIDADKSWPLNYTILRPTHEWVKVFGYRSKLDTFPRKVNEDGIKMELSSINDDGLKADDVFVIPDLDESSDSDLLQKKSNRSVSSQFTFYKSTEESPKEEVQKAPIIKVSRIPVHKSRKVLENIRKRKEMEKIRRATLPACAFYTPRGVKPKPPVAVPALDLSRVLHRNDGGLSKIPTPKKTWIYEKYSPSPRTTSTRHQTTPKSSRKKTRIPFHESRCIVEEYKRKKANEEYRRKTLPSCAFYKVRGLPPKPFKKVQLKKLDITSILKRPDLGPTKIPVPSCTKNIVDSTHLRENDSSSPVVVTPKEAESNNQGDMEFKETGNNKSNIGEMDESFYKANKLSWSEITNKQKESELFDSAVSAKYLKSLEPLSSVEGQNKVSLIGGQLERKELDRSSCSDQKDSILDFASGHVASNTSTSGSENLTTEDISAWSKMSWPAIMETSLLETSFNASVSDLKAAKHINIIKRIVGEENFVFFRKSAFSNYLTNLMPLSISSNPGSEITTSKQRSLQDLSPSLASFLTHERELQLEADYFSETTNINKSLDQTFEKVVDGVLQRGGHVSTSYCPQNDVSTTDYEENDVTANTVVAVGPGFSPTKDFNDEEMPTVSISLSIPSFEMNNKELDAIDEVNHPQLETIDEEVHEPISICGSNQSPSTSTNKLSVTRPDICDLDCHLQETATIYPEFKSYLQIAWPTEEQFSVASIKSNITEQSEPRKEAPPGSLAEEFGSCANGVPSMYLAQANVISENFSHSEEVLVSRSETFVASDDSSKLSVLSSNHTLLSGENEKTSVVLPEQTTPNLGSRVFGKPSKVSLNKQSENKKLNEVSVVSAQHAAAETGVRSLFSVCTKNKLRSNKKCTDLHLEQSLSPAESEKSMPVRSPTHKIDNSAELQVPKSQLPPIKKSLVPCNFDVDNTLRRYTGHSDVIQNKGKTLPTSRSSTAVLNSLRTTQTKPKIRQLGTPNDTALKVKELKLHEKENLTTTTSLQRLLNKLRLSETKDGRILPNNNSNFRPLSSDCNAQSEIFEPSSSSYKKNLFHFSDCCTASRGDTNLFPRHKSHVWQNRLSENSPHFIEPNMQSTSNEILSKDCSESFSTLSSGDFFRSKEDQLLSYRCEDEVPVPSADVMISQKMILHDKMLTTTVDEMAPTKSSSKSTFTGIKNKATQTTVLTTSVGVQTVGSMPTVENNFHLEQTNKLQVSKQLSTGSNTYSEIKFPGLINGEQRQLARPNEIRTPFSGSPHLHINFPCDIEVKTFLEENLYKISVDSKGSNKDKKHGAVARQQETKFPLLSSESQLSEKQNEPFTNEADSGEFDVLTPTYTSSCSIQTVIGQELDIVITDSDDNEMVTPPRTKSPIENGFHRMVEFLRRMKRFRKHCAKKYGKIKRKRKSSENQAHCSRQLDAVQETSSSTESSLLGVKPNNLNSEDVSICSRRHTRR